jgi:tRNA-splicing endonuclease subunit Sen15, fungi type
VPPRPTYIHPDLQTLLLKRTPFVPATDIPDLVTQREWVLPLTLAQKDISVEKLASIFDALPVRNAINLSSSDRSGSKDLAAAAPTSGNGKPASDDSMASASQPLATTTAAKGDSDHRTTDVATADSKSDVTRVRTTLQHQPSNAKQSWQDTKRILLAMKAHDGFGGDGTIAYYVCLEGEVKPRQNG